MSQFPRQRLLLVDRFEELSGSFSHITQEFEIATYMALKEILERLKEFNEITFFFKPDSDYPIEVLRAFKQFLKDFNLKGTIKTHYEPGSVKKGVVYFTIGDSDLWRILKDCKRQGIEVGKEVGILSNNDSPVKEIVGDGITTFSTDFEEMGRQAADFVLNRKPVQKTIPTVLIRRNSI